jgi:L-fuculokinase
VAFRPGKKHFTPKRKRILKKYFTYYFFMKTLALIFDCGATNVRVIAIDPEGEIIASKSFSNQTREDPNYKGGRIWDLDEIWGKLCTASKEVVSKIDKQAIVAVTTTSFGVDGTFLNKNGNLLYPVISWQCERTSPIMQNIDKYIPLPELYNLTGVNAYSFNTINKLIWFKENMPNISAEAESFLFMPSLINFKLTGQKRNDITMLGTSMLSTLLKRELSEKILNKIDCISDVFGIIGEAGEIVGKITPLAEVQTGIPSGTMVCLGGHDTQFAIYGSGANTNQPILSSGTWEVLMVRSTRFSTTREQLNTGITTEFDAVSGLYDIGLNRLGSGIIEWIRKQFYSELPDENSYDVMIKEAMAVQVGSNGIFINPDFNNSKNTFQKGQVTGITLNSTRGEIFRAVLEALSFQLKLSLTAIENAGGFQSEKIICVGGGSKNQLWNQIRADVVGLPIEIIQQKETTVLGASFFAFTTAGVYSSPEEGRENISYNSEFFYPSQNHKQYQKIFKQWNKLINQQ